MVSSNMYPLNLCWIVIDFLLLFNHFSSRLWICFLDPQGFIDFSAIKRVPTCHLLLIYWRSPLLDTWHNLWTCLIFWMISTIVILYSFLKGENVFVNTQQLWRFVKIWVSYFINWKWKICYLIFYPLFLYITKLIGERSS